MAGKENEKSGPHLSYLEEIEHLLLDMKFGSITLVVQDGKVIQIEKHEKFRMNNLKESN